MTTQPAEISKALCATTGLATDLDEAISQAVLGLRQAGYSWAEIAARLGITRQAALCVMWKVQVTPTACASVYMTLRLNRRWP